MGTLFGWGRRVARRAGGWLGVLGVVLGGWTHAAAPRLEVPTVAGGRVSLRITGDAGTKVQLEGSTNLSRWSRVAEGTLAGGVLSVEDVLPAGAPARFYRAVQAGAAAAPYPTVTFTEEVLLSVSTVLEPGLAGEIVVTTLTGEEARIRFPTNAVDRTTLVTMTWVSAVTGVPAVNGFVGGVRLLPEGLRLSAPATLDLPLRPGTPARQVSSYTFDGNGRNLHLVPDVVTTPRARIYVTTLRGYGAGVFTEAELSALAATVPPPRAGGGRPSKHATMEECYPEDEAAAKTMNEEIETAMAPVRQTMAYELGLERQRQLLGVESVEDEGAGMSVMGRLMADAAEFFEREIASRIPEASTRCATGRELLVWVLGWERQKQLLGAGDDDSPRWADLACQVMAQCQKQALECCRTRGGDTRLITFLLGIERQRQLLGIEGSECGQPLDVEGLLDDCAPKWFGTLTYTVRGSYSTNRSNASAIDQDRRSLEYKFEAVVESVEEKIFTETLFTPAYTNLVFQLAATATGAYSDYSFYDDLFDPCAGASPSSRALAGVGKHDGGEALLSRYQAESKLATNGVQVVVRATLMAPGSGTLGINSSLNIVIPALNAPLLGEFEEVNEGYIGDGSRCDRVERRGPVDSTYTFRGAAYRREAGGFQHSQDRISFLRITPVVDSPMLLREEVRLELRRLRP